MTPNYRGSTVSQFRRCGVAPVTAKDEALNQRPVPMYADEHFPPGTSNFFIARNCRYDSDVMFLLVKTKYLFKENDVKTNPDI